MSEEIFHLTVGGQAGQGIKATSLTLAKIAARSGKNVYTYTGFPSLIRGGHNFTQVSISKSEVNGPSNKNDFWVALDQKTLDVHAKEFVKGSFILYDEAKKYDLSKISKESIFLPVPLSQFAKETGGSELQSNTIALGAVVYLLSGDLEILKDLLKEQFGKKGEEVVNLNVQSAQKGYDFAAEHFQDKRLEVLIKEENITPKIVANGTDSVAMGAIAGGLQFAAIYPMSPISNIISVLARYQEKYRFVYKQPEDELSAINMTLGASFAGARTMTATSGGGFALMSEAYGLAGITETPVVIVEGMRPGPATGLPTWSGQGDLRFVLHAAQGDFPRIVLAAGDAKESFYLTMKALNLAEKYQTSVVLLIDKNICEDDQTMLPFDISSYEVNRGKMLYEKTDTYERYKLEEDGISTRTIPGLGNYFIGNSDEHNQTGFDSEEIEDANSQMQKRMKKLQTCKSEDMEEPVLYGPEDAQTTIVSWGSNKGSILDALKQLPNVNFLHITWVSPFPEEAIKRVLEKAKNVVNIECNYSAAMGNLIKEKTGIEIKNNILKYDGRPIFPEEIVEKMKGFSL